MSFKFECPHCTQRLSASAEMVETCATCPSCENSFTIPKPPAGIVAPTREAPDSRKGPGSTRTARFRPLLWLFYTVLALGVVIGGFVLLRAMTGRSTSNANSPTTEEAARRARITLLAAQGYVAEKEGKPNPVVFALFCGRLGAAILQLKDTGPTAPVSANARFGRFQEAIQPLTSDGFPKDVAPIWDNYRNATERLAKRFASLRPSDSQRLLSTLLAGEAVPQIGDSAQRAEIENEVAEFRRAGAGIGEAQERYRVQEILDYVNHGK